MQPMHLHEVPVGLQVRVGAQDACNFYLGGGREASPALIWRDKAGEAKVRETAVCSTVSHNREYTIIIQKVKE